MDELHPRDGQTGRFTTKETREQEGALTCEADASDAQPEIDLIDAKKIVGRSGLLKGVGLSAVRRGP